MAERSHFITGRGGVRLHVREAGRADGPAILFLHGWAHAHPAWRFQLADAALGARFRLLAMDLRGHGMSGAPEGAEHYSDNRPWAEDVRAAITQLALVRPVLVGWSYGGSVICDYLAAWGAGDLAGVNFVAPAVFFTKDDPGRWYGPGLLENAAGARSRDIAEAIAAMRGLVDACHARPLPRDYCETQLATAMLARPDVRGAMVRKRLDYGDVLAGLSVPALLSHGARDRVVLPAVSEELARLIPRARLSLFGDAGHYLFAEAPERFNAELGAFAEEAMG